MFTSNLLFMFLLSINPDNIHEAIEEANGDMVEHCVSMDETGEYCFLEVVHPDHIELRMQHEDVDKVLGTPLPGVDPELEQDTAFIPIEMTVLSTN